ncbi:hypothetical protein FQA39_LY17635 [Lamprigera yunnana]|nr:hypothetical protein FQA39_LY17635 [Lamprigera yunnana]
MSKLKVFLVDKNLPLKVWISEEPTRITARIQYDASTNQIVGLVQKPNSLTGFPDTFSYPAESASQIENFITSNHVSSLASVNMAQPFDFNVPSFCLPIYGKDNKFTGDEVLLRWRTILKEAKDVEIEVLGMSSDGDSCLLNTLEILHRLKRIQLQSDVVNVCSNDSRYLMKFPRNQQKRDNFVLQAKDASIKDATNLGMETTDDLRSKLTPVSISSEENYCEETLDEKREVNVQNSNANIEFFENNDIGGFTKEGLTLLQSCGGLNLKDYSKEYNKDEKRWSASSRSEQTCKLPGLNVLFLGLFRQPVVNKLLLPGGVRNAVLC